MSSLEHVFLHIYVGISIKFCLGVVFLPGESQGRVGCRLWGRTESDTTEATAAAAAAQHRHLEREALTGFRNTFDDYQSD